MLQYSNNTAATSNSFTFVCPQTFFDIVSQPDGGLFGQSKEFNRY